MANIFVYCLFFLVGTNWNKLCYGLPDGKQDSANRSTEGHSDLRTILLQNVAQPMSASSHKVTIVGTGAVGMACAYSILNQKLSSDICLIDVDENKVKGEQMDLQHGSAFLNGAVIKAGTDYSLTGNSKIIIICAGVRRREGESRLSLLKRNYEVMKSMIPQLVQSSPNAILLIVSNPVDVMTYIAWKISGFPRNRVIGSGTNLDTSRFRFIISEKLGVSPDSVHGWIIGEHGDSSVAVWSSVNIAGVNLQDLNPNITTDDEKNDWKGIHGEVVTSGAQVIKLKGYTSWAIGASVADLCSTILHNVAKVHCVSVYSKGLYGIEDESYLSLPATLGENGVTNVVKMILNDQEEKRLRQSAKVMGDAISELGI